MLNALRRQEWLRERVLMLQVQSILAIRVFHIRGFAHPREIKCNPFFAIYWHLATIHGHEQQANNFETPTAQRRR